MMLNQCFAIGGTFTFVSVVVVHVYIIKVYCRVFMASLKIIYGYASFFLYGKYKTVRKYYEKSCNQEV